VLRYRWLAWGVLAVGLASPRGASADQPSTTTARKLAIEAADRLDEKRFDEALARATKAEALYHAPTHLLIMAQALEGLGRLVEALEIYERLTAEPLPATAPKAFRTARGDGDKRQRALLARVPSVLVQVSGAPEPEITATLDGKPLALGGGAAIRVNPGKHTVAASAKGRKTANRVVELAEKGGVVTVEIALERDPTAPGAGAEAAPAAPRGPTLRIPAFVAFGVGVAGIGVGAATGVLSLRRVGELRDACPTHHCAPAQQSLIDEGKLFGTISTIGFAVGGAGAVTGLVLILVGNAGSTPEKASVAAPRAGIEPWAAFGAGGVRGWF
jgi:hypothetical protein